MYLVTSKVCYEYSLIVFLWNPQVLTALWAFSNQFRSLVYIGKYKTTTTTKKKKKKQKKKKTTTTKKPAVIRR